MTLKQYTSLALLILISAKGWAEENGNRNGYRFSTIVEQKVTPVKDQAVSGTCWCFATTSFMEAELLRQGKGEYDLSEMFIVRQKYLNQLEDNFLRKGKGNIGQGHHHQLDNSLQPSRYCARRSLSEHQLRLFRP